MTDMTLEQVRDELRSRGMEGTMQPSYEFCDELADAIDAYLAKAAEPVEAADEHMSIAVALSFADDPRPYQSLVSAAAANGELYRALSVLAREYRAALAHPRPTGAPVEVSNVATKLLDALRADMAEGFGKISVSCSALELVCEHIVVGEKS